MNDKKREILEDLFEGTTRMLTKKNRGSVCMRCLFTFWYEGIMRERNKFEIVFPGKYSVNVFGRIGDWIKYYFENLIIWYIKNFKYGFKKLRKNYDILEKNGIEYAPYKPVHVKLSNSPDEAFLYAYLENCGLKITDEYIDGYIMVYNVEVQ